MTKKITPEYEIHYSYLHKSNLLKHQLTYYNGCIQERIFHFYDSNGFLVERIEDDGNSIHHDHLDNVTVRKVTSIIPVKDPNHPAFGKPNILK